MPLFKPSAACPLSPAAELRVSTNFGLGKVQQRFGLALSGRNCCQQSSSAHCDSERLLTSVALLVLSWVAGTKADLVWLVKLACN